MTSTLFLASLALTSTASATNDDARLRVLSALTAGQEVQDPSLDDVESAGVAQARIVVDDDDSFIRVSLALRITSGTDITRFHIHDGVFGVNGGIVVNFFDVVTGQDAHTIPVNEDGLTRLTFRLNVSESVARDLVNDPESYYFNVHTEQFPAGEVRGQLLDASFARGRY